MATAATWITSADRRGRRYRFPNPKKSTKLSTLELYVLNAEANGGGWVQFMFHRLYEQCGPYAVTPAELTAFLDFLQGEVTGGRVVVQTTAHVIGGPVQPPVLPLDGVSLS